MVSAQSATSVPAASGSIGVLAAERDVVLLVESLSRGRSSPGFDPWLSTDPADQVRELLGCPALVENDANLRAVGESALGCGAFGPRLGGPQRKDVVSVRGSDYATSHGARSSLSEQDGTIVEPVEFDAGRGRHGRAVHH